MARTDHFTNRQKAAILLISLGPEVASTIYHHLREDEIEELTLEIAALRRVESEERSSILKEFHELAVAQDYITQGGIEYAREILQKALGAERAVAIIDRLTASLQVRPFEFARKANPSQVLGFIQNEHPQTIALVLSYLDAAQASTILGALPTALRTEVARRIATMDAMSPEVVSTVERVLENKLAQTASPDSMNVGGLDAIVQIINGVDRATEKSILEQLEESDPELAEEIKKRMFVFEDIVFLDNRAIQRVIRDVEQSDLQLALRTASEDVQEAIYRNMSKRMVETFKQDMEFAGPVRLRDVEDAQQRIVAQIRQLEDMGEIVISRGGGDDILV
ncbi:flagellar motor switch protein FliG [Sulfoacidibacillus thermotolerans]|uniref:Flagellar motor switch protein FliG n=1 Tax=Sulfoacidibacillus thermotolerans TaxID=1765684 RepID=A0A2U3DA78_SULT2|nr:flagellar motor switch protein FliG [Sulfoacidibacillus thermotolerans]PWI58186.1 flagellar motor switch protein FliG [Sulfoacidibacillus thermotolerans]